VAVVVMTMKRMSATSVNPSGRSSRILKVELESSRSGGGYGDCIFTVKSTFITPR
jgi:hypothetical protein